MLDFRLLPTIVFIAEDGAEQALVLRESAPRVRAIGAHLAGRIPRGAVIGLLFPTGPALVLAWLGCLHAGLRPLVMQYPTRKQSRAYWSDSVRNTIATAGLAAIVADDHCCSLGLSELTPMVSEAELAALPAAAPAGAAAAPLTIDDFAIIQLSSGTTGHRKAVEFTAAALRRHVDDYNATLGLTPSDCIVSWLPLYHDMGYVACFVMPLLLGIPVVMMDPMAWVRRPHLLSDAIARHNGTVCYQPNFGFEVMARAPARALPSMRWWISCSEPISPETSRRFLAHVGATDSSFAACYAMAENIFAISVGRGIATRTIDDVAVISCGAPIAGVAFKTVEGEIWVRSPTSIAAYLGGEDIRDADGYYPTGDLGEILDGQLYVTGRKQDLLIQAGRKFMLSDIDLALNRLYPEIRGRAAALAVYDDRLGTQLPLVLIEAADFFERADQPVIAEALRGALGIDQIEVAFVPPRFLTKTSSGKVNRKASAANWALHCAASRHDRPHQGDPVAELHAEFAAADWALPVETGLDSLSLTVLRVILAQTSLAYDGTMSLDEIVTALAALLAKTPAPAPTEQVIRIVSLADAPVIGSITEAHLDRLGERLGARVTLEHVCLPPSIVLLSDLVFHDWFQPRLDPVEFVAVDRAIAKLRGASVILADDMAEMFFPPQQVYGALSHNLERDPRTDLVAVRWQRYPRNHHRLPLTLVCGADLPLDQCTPALEALSRILGVPFFRMAVVAGFAEYTEGWEYRPLHGGTDAHLAVRGVINPDEWVDRFAAWAATQPGGLRLRPATPGPRIETSDLAHFCSHYARADAIDAIIARFGSFCVVGQDASVPYVRAALARAGKPFVHARSYAPEAMAKLNGQYECLLICGPQGNFPINTPAAGIMRSDSKWVTKNIDDPATAALTFHVPRPDLPASGEDWFHRFAFDRRRSAKAYVAVRIKAVRRAREAADAERVAAAKAKQRASPAPGSGQAGLSPERLALREQRLQQLRQDRREARQRERAALRQASSQPAKPSAP